MGTDIINHYSNMNNFSREKCRDVFIQILKAMGIHGEHSENIPPIIQAAFSTYKEHSTDLQNVLLQIPNVEQVAIVNLNNALNDAKTGEKKQRFVFYLPTNS